jgi:Rhodopirellula transposase DDE domain
MAVAVESLARRYEALRPHLSERQRRLWLGAEARELGAGGAAVVASAVGVAADTVRRGRSELDDAQPPPVGRSRRPGGGRKRAEAHDPGLVAALEALVDPDTRGDPQSPLRWTCKSLRALAAALREQGHQVSEFVVRRLLLEAGYSLQANVKTAEGGEHPDRDAQFGYLNAQAKDHQAVGCPVISVDAKKKELVGEFKNAGREWRPTGQPEQVNVYDFIDKQLGKVTPYGVYDLAANTGWVSVGTDHDTAAFAVATIARWWQTVGQSAYPGADRLLITADGGGSNGYRTRPWKTELADFATRTGLTITVCHLPPGTSKWNKIEHRLFSHISMNWRGRPLTSHDVIVQTITATTTRSGLAVHAELDTAAYPTGVKVPDQDMKALTTTGILARHDFHGEWNYTLHPADHQPGHTQGEKT